MLAEIFWDKIEITASFSVFIRSQADLKNLLVWLENEMEDNVNKCKAIHAQEKMTFLI